MSDLEMYVTKRNSQLEIVSFDKILRRIKKVGQEVNLTKIHFTTLAMKVIDQLYDKISTTKIDELTAEQCASMSSIHPEYNILAGRIVVSNHHRSTSSSFVDVMQQLFNYRDKQEKHSPLLSEDFITILKQLGGKKVLDKICNYDRDYLIEYFGFKTLEKSYLMKINRKTVERPQHMWLRVSITIHGTNLAKVMETYEFMSQKYFTHATPTLFNAGTPHPQLSSCYLISMESDSIDGIFNTLKDCALISKWAGGIGLHIHNVRATGSHIRGTNGASNGIVPMLKVFNNTAKYVDQCFLPETILYTTDGPQKIQNVISGKTETLNREGRIEKISKKLEFEYSGEMQEIITNQSIDKITCTTEHLFYILKRQKRDEISFRNKNPPIYFRDFEWVESKNIEVGDLCISRIPDSGTNLTIDEKNITIEDCYMYGILLSQYESFEKTDRSFSTIRIFSMDTNLIDFLEKYFCDYSILYNKHKLQNENGLDILHYCVSNISNIPFQISDFCNGISNNYLRLPFEKISQILKGWNDNRIDKKIHSSFYYGFHFMCLRLGIFSYVSNNQYVLCKSPRTCEILGLSFSEEAYFYSYRPHLLYPIDNPKYILSEVISNQTIEYSGMVYDLQMEIEHNYALSTGIVHNGGGKRNGSIAIYLEPWHADILMFLQMRKNHGDEELKARDLFYALWIPDLFMERVKANGTWTLMCPDECPGLSDVYGDAFRELYERYELEKKGRNTIPARDLWLQILDAQMETGTPYLLYKDAANQKSNQKNVGIIKSSNLCTEIMEYSDENETAVCNLASIGLPCCIQLSENNDKRFDFEKLHQVTKIVTENLNRIIDVNYYPTEKTKKSNFRHRPIGIGIQGLADVFLQLGFAFTSEEAKKLNRDIFETIYHAALEKSCELAEVEGAYETFAGSPASQGILQFDMWKVDPGNSRYDWTELKSRIIEKGLRNSLLLAPMPTASTSQILGFNECMEPITSNIYSRRTLAGEFILVNKYLMYDLLALNLWNETLKNNIIANNGSIQHMENIPMEIREKYKTVWEIPMRCLIDMSADRGAFICQSQSLNLWLEDPNYNTLTSMHFYAWSKGLKTGIYYLRRRPKHQAQQFTIEPEKAMKNGGISEEVCEMCSA